MLQTNMKYGCATWPYRIVGRVGVSFVMTCWLALTIAFFALRLLPGDGVAAQLVQAGLGPSEIERRREALGLDQPVWWQYSVYLTGVVQGNLGVSLVTGRPVQVMIGEKIGTTLTLALPALALAILIGLFLGSLAGLDAGYGVSTIAQFIINLSFSVPIFWTATLLVFVFTLNASSLWMPILVLAFHAAGGIARITEASLLDTRRAEFVRTAYGKGLSKHRVVLWHILRPALSPAIAVIALQAGILFSGTVITETVFLQPGIGVLLLNAVREQDYTVVQGIVLLVAAFYAGLNSMADLISHWLDPRLSFA